MAFTTRSKKLSPATSPNDWCMSTHANPRHLAERAEVLTRELREIINQMISVGPTAESEEKKNQLREISRTVERLESSQVSVPSELRNLKTALITELSIEEETGDAIASLLGELLAIQSELQKRLPSMDRESKQRRRHPRSGSPKTEKRVLRENLIKALKAHGGRATINDTLKWMREHLQHRFLPGDLETRASGEVVWENNTCWERYNLVQEGVLKSDSPRGIWELNGEDH